MLSLASRVLPLNAKVPEAFYASKDYQFTLLDGNGNSIIYTLNTSGSINIAYADNTNESFAYNTHGQLISKTERSGDTFNYIYDDNGRLSTRGGPDFTEFYSYDSNDRLLEASRSPVGVGSAQSTTFTYGDNGKISKIDYGPSGRNISYSYDSQGRRSGYITDDGFEVRYSYNIEGRLSGLRNGSNQQLVDYLYNTDGRLSRETKGNGTSSTYSYDAKGQLIRIDNYNPAGIISSSLQYAYDAKGQRIGEIGPDGSWNYSYDAIGQLIKADFISSNGAISNQSQKYIYDSAHNRTSTKVNGTQINYTSNNLNQYISVDSASYSYDADGNQTRASDASYIYNSENRLVRMSRGDNIWEYEYDLLGNRSAVIHNGQVTSFLVDPLSGYGNVVGVYKSDGSLDAHYAHGNGLLAGFGPGGGWYYEADAIGSVRNYTDDSGNSLTGGITYDPFGGQLGGDARGLATSAQARYGFVGKLGVEQDGSGLVYMRARQYDPTIGRFTSADPLGVNGGSDNINSYANNNPVVFVDANGLRSQSEINASIRDALAARTSAQNAYEGFVLAAGVATLFGNIPLAIALGLSAAGMAILVNETDHLIELLRLEQPTPPCLASGTLIRTPSGNRPVEELQIGDLVLTPDGTLPLKFLGISTRHVNSLKASGRMPIRIQSGVFGHNLPSADIYCTPSHAFALGDCLVEAQALINGQSIYQLEELSEFDQRRQIEPQSPLAEQKEADSFTYYSLEFEQHALVWANDLLTESYLPTYRDGELTRVAWNNYDNYLSLYGSSETMDELPMPRIPFSRQIPLRIREQFGLDSIYGPSTSGANRPLCQQSCPLGLTHPPGA
jgi:RHS repeat-associated protein